MFKINKRYNFNTVAPTVLGDRYELMKLKSILSLDEAIKKYDVYTQHEKVKKYLDAEYNIKDLTFFHFINGSTEKIIPDVYIISNSIVEVDKVNILIEVDNVVTEDISAIAEILTSHGYIKPRISLKKY